MKKLLFIMLIALLGASAYGQTNEEVTALQYFKSLRLKILDRLPASFSGELTGFSISNKLASIPKDSYKESTQNAYVQISYSKKLGISIEVKNVDELYRDLYKDLPKQIFAFDLILSSESNDSFLNRYNITYVSKTKDLVVLKLGVKSAENSLLLYILPDRNLIQRVDYKMGKDLISSTVLGYLDVSSSADQLKYMIPNKFLSKIFRDSRDSRPDVVEIKSIKVN